MILTTLNASLSSRLTIGGFPIESVSLTAVEVNASGNPAQVYSSKYDAKQVMNLQLTLDLATGATATIMSTDDDAFRYIIKKQISASSF